VQIWAIGTTRNEVDLVRTNILHHLSQGVDRFLLLDDQSVDGTRDMLSDLARTYPVEWSPYSGSFRQDQLLTALAVKAFERGADWILPVDADEFWRAPFSSLRRVLEHCRESALRVDLANFIQRRDQMENTPGALLSMTRTAARPLGSMEAGEELVESEQIAYVEHCYHYKWLFRGAEALQIGWGNHVLSGLTGTWRATEEIECLHAPLRSFAALLTKLDVDRSATEIGEYFAVAWHLRRWRRLAAEGRLEAEWKANSYLDDQLDVFGRKRPVVVDDRLREAVEPWQPSVVARGEGR